MVEVVETTSLNKLVLFGTLKLGTLLLALQMKRDYSGWLFRQVGWPTTFEILFSKDSTLSKNTALTEIRVPKKSSNSLHELWTFVIFTNNEDFPPFLSAVFENCYLIPRIFFSNNRNILTTCCKYMLVIYHCCIRYLVKLWKFGDLAWGSFIKKISRIKILHRVLKMENYYIINM